MRVGIDAREIEEGVRTGIGRALSVFLEHVPAVDPDCHCVLFSTREIPCKPAPHLRNVVRPERWTFAWDQRTLPRLAREDQIDVLLSPYYKVPLQCPCPRVSTIFDLMYLYCDVYRANSSLFNRLYYRVFGTMMTRAAAAIFTCSEYSKAEIVRFYRVAGDKVHVVPLGLDPHYRPSADTKDSRATKRRFGITHDYILYVGNFKPHKNVSALIDAFEGIRRKRPDVQLVLAGAKDEHFARLEPVIATSDSRDAVVTTGTVSLQEQIDLYSAAVVCVVPSLYEGFGYPALEAMACGSPIVCSNRTSLPEVYGEAAVGVDPADIGAIERGVLSLLKNRGRREELRERGLRRAEQFGAQEYARGLYSLLALSTGSNTGR